MSKLCHPVEGTYQIKVCLLHKLVIVIEMVVEPGYQVFLVD